MEWLEKLAEQRRKQDPECAALEAQIEAEDGGYEIDFVTDEEGVPLQIPIRVAAGDSKGSYHIA